MRKIIDEYIYMDLIGQMEKETSYIVDELIKEKKVSISKVTYENATNFEIHAIVHEFSKNYKSYIKVQEGEIQNLSCDCDDYKNNYCACRHIIAMVKEFSQNSEYIRIFAGNSEKFKIEEKTDNLDNYTVYKQLIKEFYQEQQEQEKLEESTALENTIRIEPILIFNRYTNNLKLEAKIGDKQLYKIKSFPEFYDRFINTEKYKYGAKLELVHDKKQFNQESQKLLDFILKYAEIIKYANEASTGYDYYTKRIGEDSITISKSGLDELFEALEGRTIQLEDMYDNKNVFFTSEEPKIKFNLEEINTNEYKITSSIDIYAYQIYEGKQYTYLLLEDKLYRCSNKYKNTVIRLLEIFRKNFTKEIVLPKSRISDFFSVVEPVIKNNLNIGEEQYKKLKKYIPAEFSAKLYLDYNDKNYIIADVRFLYEDVEINPLANEKEIKEISRNTVREEKLINMFVKSGFMLDQENDRLVLVQEDRIYEFLTSGINLYMKNFEILATEKFKAKEVKSTSSINLGVRIENNLLDIDFSNLYFDISELQEIMKKYKLKKKYHRLKNGDFINLEENDNIEFIENITEDIDVDYSQIKNGNLHLPMYRALYLDKILEKNTSIHVTKDENYKNLIERVDAKELDANIEIPRNIKAELREYQKVGAKWLKTLDLYGLGGILADDMGLGKTVQVLCVVCSYLEENKENSKPILVVCPSSLCLNWQNEIEKFTIGVSSIVIHGSQQERKMQIENIKNCNIAVTSYDLLKRDIDEYKAQGYNFKYIIADEAQYIKNNNTQNAKAIKEIMAETRFALTGTPIENSLSELWSIFDFIMPGYLFGYRKFKEMYETPIVRGEDTIQMNKLKKLIEPFVLRRIKGEVLTELPEKMVSVLNSQMLDEQQDIYLSYLANAKKDALQEIRENGIEKSQIKILALLTRLRQICCHPGLFIENYNGGSGKLNQCIEIVKDAISAGHKILLFSGYTSMFEIIEKELRKEGIEYLKLTGQTKVSERMDLVEEFNNNPEKKLFLISLKAGGTGLNLIGADMVIHYDPWWNLSAENQATDRTYRIGQKRNVQVYKLITKNSIEEKIYEIQKRKEKLMDNMLSTNQTFISKLSKEEIMNLFE